jgi:hypothetical protein
MKAAVLGKKRGTVHKHLPLEEPSRHTPHEADVILLGDIKGRRPLATFYPHFSPSLKAMRAALSSSGGQNSPL